MLSIALHSCPGLNTVAKLWQQIVLVILAKKIKRTVRNVQKKQQIQQKITNSTRLANCSKTLLQMFVAILAKIDLIEIACKNLVSESAKIAKVTRNFITPKNTQITYRTNSKNNNVYSKQIRLTKKKVLKTLKRKLENFAKIEKLTRIIY